MIEHRRGNDIGSSGERHLCIDAGEDAERVMVFTCEIT
jgi:hypothetical protein